MKKFTTEQFLNKAKEIHNDKYDYSKVIYVTTKIKVTIICPIHGEFEQRPSAHMFGRVFKSYKSFTAIKPLLL